MRKELFVSICLLSNIVCLVTGNHDTLPASVEGTEATTTIPPNAINMVANISSLDYRNVETGNESISSDGEWLTSGETENPAKGNHFSLEEDAKEAKYYLIIRKLLKESPLIDGHNDLPWNIRRFVHSQLQDFQFDSNLKSAQPWSKSSWSHTDLPRLRKGLIGAQFWVAYTPCEAQGLDAVQITLEQIDLIKRLIAKYPNHLQLALSSHDIEVIHRKGKIASLIAVEGGHCIGNSLAVLREFYQLGVRYMTLTNACNTPWADSHIVEKPGKHPLHGGLTDFGRSVVREMNRLGMLVDLSRTSTLTVKDALKISAAPVIFSHSGAYHLCNSSRNVPDDILKELVSNRGLVMVTFYNQHVTCQKHASVQDVADHISYIASKIGVDYVGVGGNFDGINWTPEGLEDVSKYPNLFVQLAKRYWSKGNLKKLAGRNLLRVFKAAENVRDFLHSSGEPPHEDIISHVHVKAQARCRSASNKSTS